MAAFRATLAKMLARRFSGRHPAIRLDISMVVPIEKGICQRFDHLFRWRYPVLNRHQALIGMNQATVIMWLSVARFSIWQLIGFYLNNWRLLSANPRWVWFTYCAIIYDATSDSCYRTRRRFRMSLEEFWELYVDQTFQDLLRISNTHISDRPNTEPKLCWKRFGF